MKIFETLKFLFRVYRFSGFHDFLRTLKYRIISFSQRFLFFFIKMNLISGYPGLGKLRTLELSRINFFFLCYKDPERLRKALEKNCPSFLNSLFSLCEKFMMDEHDILGSGPVKFGKSYPWHEDFKSGYRWDPDTFFKDIKYGNVRGVDVKVPWELSRLQFLPPLSLAYILTGNEVFRDRIISLVEDWEKSNKPMRGVNWNCTMDVSIRLANLTFTFTNIIHSLDEKTLEKFLRLHLLHTKHIMRNLEWNPFYTSNHYMANICGLLISTLPFRDFPYYRNVFQFALKEYFNEILKQFREDGTNFESSSYYHCFVLEMVIYPLLFLKREGISLDGRILERLKKAVEFSFYLHSPDGEIVQVGDMDSGKFFSLTKRKRRNFYHLLSFGSHIFNVFFPFKDEEIFLFVPEENLEKRKMDEELKEYFVSFEEGNIHIFKNGEFYFVFLNPVQGTKGIGNHNHNDKLSFVIFFKGIEFFSDPGTFIYTPYPEYRNLFRSTSYHNTISVNDVEQCSFVDWSLFYLKDEAEVYSEARREGEGVFVFRGYHTGYRKIGIDQHFREIRLNVKERRVVIKDFLKGKKRIFKFKIHFILHPHVNVREEEDAVILEREGSFCQMKKNTSLKFRIEEAFYSPEYGVKLKSKKIVFEGYFQGETSVESELIFSG